MAKKKKNKDKKSDVKIKKVIHIEEVKRLNRIQGQLEGVSKMMHDSRGVADILVQCKAVRSALKSIEERLFLTHVEEAADAILKSEKKKNRAEVTKKLVSLYKHV